MRKRAVSAPPRTFKLPQRFKDNAGKLLNTSSLLLSLCTSSLSLSSPISPLSPLSPLYPLSSLLSPLSSLLSPLSPLPSPLSPLPSPLSPLPSPLSPLPSPLPFPSLPSPYPASLLPHSNINNSSESLGPGPGGYQHKTHIGSSHAFSIAGIHLISSCVSFHRLTNKQENHRSINTSSHLAQGLTSTNLHHEMVCPSLAVTNPPSHQIPLVLVLTGNLSYCPLFYSFLVVFYILSHLRSHI